MIEAKGISKIYRKGQVETVALRKADITIKEGEYVAIIGKSGAGKSTLMYQLSLLDVPTEGVVSVNGKDTTKFTNKERTRYRLENLGYVFQDYALLPELSASDNVMVPLLMLGESFARAKSRACEVLTHLGLGERVNNLPSQLSGGEQQRVSVARAIAHDPLILFADEPTANLDSATSIMLLEYIEKLHKDGQTVVMVTHEKDYAKRAERIVMLDDGEIIADGTPKKVLQSKRK